VAEAVEQDARAILESIAASEDLRTYIADPYALPEQKARAFAALFGGKVDGITMRFLEILCDRRRDRHLREILSSFLQQRDRERGVVSAVVSSAIPLTESQRTRLAERLSRYTGMRVVLDASVDPSLRAGLIARVGDEVFDGTLDTMLSGIHRQMSTGSRS
jgi:F-type H+-transporting ATPase subunit delta